MNVIMEELKGKEYNADYSLKSKYRVIVIEKFGYGYSDIFECSCDIDSLVSFQREALEKVGEKGPFILLPHLMSGSRYCEES